MYFVKNLNTGYYHRGIITNLNGVDVLITPYNTFAMELMVNKPDSLFTQPEVKLINTLVHHMVLPKPDKRGIPTKEIFEGELELFHKLKELIEDVVENDSEDSWNEVDSFNNIYHTLMYAKLGKRSYINPLITYLELSKIDNIKNVSMENNSMKNNNELTLFVEFNDTNFNDKITCLQTYVSEELDQVVTINKVVNGKTVTLNFNFPVTVYVSYSSLEDSIKELLF